VVLLASLVGLGAAVVSSAANPGGSTRVRAEAAGTEAEAFYREVRTSLAPLLDDAPRLEALIREASSGSSPKPAVAGMALTWAEHFAEAEERIGRLTAPEGVPRSAQARALYEIGAALYGEAARTVPRLVEAAEEPRRRAALHAVRRLQMLGDRSFDGGNRLLPERHRDGGLEVRRILPPAVPDFRALGLDGGADRAGPVPPVADESAEPRVDPQRWLALHGHHLQEAVNSLADSAHRIVAGGPPDETDAAARRPAAVAEALAGPLPNTVAAEGVHVARLSLLVSSEALHSLAAGTGAAGQDQARRLHHIAERLWSLGRDLLAFGGVDHGVLSVPRGGIPPQASKAA
jgi:hypothetical protein